RAAAIGKCAETTTPARTRGFIEHRSLVLERAPVVIRSRNPDAALPFFALSGNVCMPHDIHVPVAVGSDRASAVDVVAAMHDIALRLECGLFRVQPRVE